MLPKVSPPVRKAGLTAAAAALVAAASGLQAQDDPMSAVGKAVAAEDLEVVDCLLPGRVRKLGGKMTYLTPKRPTKSSAVDCEIRGGEYTAWDRATYDSSLTVWLGPAEKGDAVAQTYVGEIYEKRLDAPDYQQAAKWYQLAAEQGHERAQRHLAYLYERGLGVAKDPIAALSWYRKASGITDDELVFASAVEEAQAQAGERIDALTRELEEQNREAHALRTDLDRANGQLAAKRAELAAAQREFRVAESGLAGSGENKGAAGTDRELAAQQARIARQEQELALIQAEAEVQRAKLDASLKAAALKDLQLQEELVRQTEAAAAARAQLASTEHDLMSTRQKLSLAEAEIAETNQAVEAERELLDIERQRLEARRQAAAADQSRVLRNMAGELEERSSALEEQAAMIKQLELEADRYRQELAGLNGARRQQIAMRTAQAPSPAPASPPELTLPRGTRLGRFHALVIGNSNYEHLPDLQTAEGDAMAVERLLSEKYGFQTELLVNGDRVAMFSALYNLRARLGPNDNLLIYYAGHGEIDRANRQSYWLPVNARSQGFDRISNQQITEQINLMKARHVIVVADSCYSGAMTRPMVSVKHGDPAKRLKYLAQLPSRTVLTSGGEVPVLDGGGGDHSVFAKSFIRILSANKGVMMGETLHAELLERVRYDASRFNVDQHPEFSELADAGHENGQFLFVPRT